MQKVYHIFVSKENATMQLLVQSNIQSFEPTDQIDKFCKKEYKYYSVEISPEIAIFFWNKNQRSFESGLAQQYHH